MSRAVGTFGLVSVVALSLVTGCGARPHVRLQAPAANGSEQERAAAYERLAPQAESGVVVVSGQQVVASATEFLILGDGTRVSHADDLLAVVPEDSTTARAARRSKAAKARGDKWMIASGLVTVVGLGLIGHGIYTSTVTHGEPSDPDFMKISSALYVGLAMVAGGAGMWIPGNIEYRDASDERTVAFASYRRDLAVGLRVCVQGLRVENCDTQLDSGGVSALPLLPPPRQVALAVPGLVKPAIMDVPRLP